MTSIRAKLVNRYFRWTFKTKALHKIDPVALRAGVEKNSLRLLPKGIKLEVVNTQRVNGEWHCPDAGNAKLTVLYLHGGGYVFGSPKTHRSVTFPLALAANAAVFSASYRLAPEHPCPAAIEDALAVYDWLAASGQQPERIVLAGDSAGGGLCLALLGELKSRGGKMPAGAVLYSPWTDLACTGAAINDNKDSDAMFMQAAITGGAPKYYGALPPADPRVSPLYGDPTGFPPLLIFASSSEMLRDDSIRFVEKARAAGVDVDFELRDGLIHVWPIFSPLMPEAGEAIAKSAAFIKKHAAA